jgi:hypothetical protein
MAIDPGELKGRKLGRVLTKLGKVTREQVHEALEIQKTKKCRRSASCSSSWGTAVNGCVRGPGRSGGDGVHGPDVVV